MSDSDKVSKVLIPNPLDRPEVFGRRRFIAGASAALAAVALSSRQAAAQDIQKVTEAQHGQSASDPGPENELLREASPNSLLPPPPITERFRHSGTLSPSNIGAFNQVAGPGK